MLHLRQTKQGIKARLDRLPNNNQLGSLNANASGGSSYRLDGNKLLVDTPTTTLPCTMECPINQWFTV